MDVHSYLGQVVRIEIDRPMGSRHLQHGFLYEVNYGYLPGVPAPDGESLDAYLLGVHVPVREYIGRCVAVIHRLDDEDDKLVIVPEGVFFTDEEILGLVHFQEQFFRSIILR